jgi:two-component system cell cycle sensor histidine kinase PleC
VAVVGGLDRGGGAVIRIEDTGIGIAADALERVFTPFERLGDVEPTAIEGTGLGLSITRGLVALHGGTVRLESAPGRGTSAIVSLPASRVVSAGMRLHEVRAAAD